MEEGTEEELNAIVAEYLTSVGYLQTRAMFQTEEHERRKRKATPIQTPGAKIQSEFVMALECGERAAFFELWDQHIPQELRESDPTCQNLEFCLTVYFAIFPLRAGVGDAGRSMAEFKSYLESRGAVLAQSQEFATYCALPYIPDPTKHPSFKSLFSDSWPLELKARLLQLLKSTLPQLSNSPRLLTLLTDSKMPSGTSDAVVLSLQSQLADCEKRYMKRLTEIQSSYHTLVGIAMELVEALESAVAGRMITPEYIQSMCSRLFGSAVQQSIDRQGTTTSTSLLRASVMSLKDSAMQPLTTSLPVSSSYPPLDYSQLKADLGSLTERKKALVIQALRWRLTRSLSGEQRNTILSSYVQADILGCSTAGEHQATVLRLLTSPEGNLTREHLCRLFNTLSSLAGGRGYLASCPTHIRALCGVMMAEEGDTHTRRNALGAVQKLSLKRSLQTLMIKCGLLQWLFNTLRQHDSISDYTLRYSLALTMNLSLRTAGKKACVAFRSTALRVLGELLEHEDQEICSYVNGILYSLLSQREVQDEARKMGLGEMLASALQASSPELQSQLKYIITQLGSDSVPSGDDSGDEGDDDEEDPELIEGDDGEVLIASGEGVSGEALLCKEYILASPDGGREEEGEREGAATKILDAPYTRPVTPQVFSHRPQTANVPVHPPRGAEADLVGRSASSAN